MAIYELVSIGVCEGQFCNNVFHYAPDFAGALPGGAEGLALAFASDILGAILDIQSTEYAMSQIRVRDVYNDQDFFETTFVAPVPIGTRPSESCPPFVAASFRGDRLGVGFNRWYKRFAGLGEGDVSGNNFLVEQAVIDALTGVLNDSLLINTDLGNVTVLPWLIRKEKYLTPSGKDAYRYYATESAQRANMYSMLNVPIVFRRLTSQRSRLLGQGL